MSRKLTVTTTFEVTVPDDRAICSVIARAAMRHWARDDVFTGCAESGDVSLYTFGSGDAFDPYNMVVKVTHDFTNEYASTPPVDLVGLTLECIEDREAVETRLAKLALDTGFERAKA